MSNLEKRFREVAQEILPLPARGQTAQRLHRLFEVGREDLSLAKLAEAHWDAIAILAQSGHEPEPNVTYAVWGSESPDTTLTLTPCEDGWILNGNKMFCSGAGIVDRALITVNSPKRMLVNVDMWNHPSGVIQMTQEPWQILAFNETKTSMVAFNQLHLHQDEVIEEHEWYFRRAGFWHGSLGPAACWAGGAAGLLDYALNSQRKDSHTLVHLAAMASNIWAMQSYLQTAGQEIDELPQDVLQAQVRGLKVRHLIEQLCTDTLRRFARAYGPFPLACDTRISRHYQELDLFLRQCHAERDLESLGRNLFEIYKDTLALSPSGI